MDNFNFYATAYFTFDITRQNYIQIIYTTISGGKKCTLI